MDSIKAGKLKPIWRAILRDSEARRALTRLKIAGFDLTGFVPRDDGFRAPNWADYIAALPLVPNTPSRRWIHWKTESRKYRAVVDIMRKLTNAMDDPFCDVRIEGPKDYSRDDIKGFKKRLADCAQFLEEFLSWDWVARDLNPRNILIAELRWQIRWRTGRPHDPELAALIDTAFRAAGVKNGLYIDATALDRMEKREKEGRVKAVRRLHSRANRS